MLLFACLLLITCRGLAGPSWSDGADDDVGPTSSVVSGSGIEAPDMENDGAKRDPTIDPVAFRASMRKRFCEVAVGTSPSKERDIQRAYLRESLQWHPDKAPTTDAHESYTMAFNIMKEARDEACDRVVFDLKYPGFDAASVMTPGEASDVWIQKPLCQDYGAAPEVRRGANAIVQAAIMTTVWRAQDIIEHMTSLPVAAPDARPGISAPVPDIGNLILSKYLEQAVKARLAPDEDAAYRDVFLPAMRKLARYRAVKTIGIRTIDIASIMPRFWFRLVRWTSLGQRVSELASRLAPGQPPMSTPEAIRTLVTLARMPTWPDAVADLLTFVYFSVASNQLRQIVIPNNRF
ncbi:J domain-containing protein [Plasmodiophora brassicae]